ncbi:MAG: peptidoglycan DD-metalloendopeptidase family protein [Prevotellaceae bacterium]|jgi:murein DD-endopeptidase MepM/ murein hydrolase activator NlpD|nr:peptidoglycan DD-metalloendopeptidase family protein [Prevotellaceae bacterium]
MTKLTKVKYLLLMLVFLLKGTDIAYSQLVQDSVDLQPYDLMIEEDENDGYDSTQVACATDTTPPAFAIYGSAWNNQDVNPYKISLVDMTDTVQVDLSGYTHPNRNVITSRFGFRRWKFHYGIDLRCAVGDSIRSAFAGRVRIAKRGKAYGNYVVVRHYNGLETTYAHLNKILVKVNDEVKSGDLVGWGGNTGRSTGPHLHYEMRFLGEAIDPTALVDFATGKVHSHELRLTAGNFEYVKDVDQVRYWIVRSGDSLWRISRKTGVSVAQLCRLNGIKSSSVLSLGQHIRYT